MSVKMRQLVENEITAKVVDVLLAAGYGLSVDNGDNNGDEYEIKNSHNFAKVLKALYQTDDDRLYVHHNAVEPFAWVHFVYGNDGWDVISDYTTNLEKLIGKGTEVERLVDKYAD